MKNKVFGIVYAVLILSFIISHTANAQPIVCGAERTDVYLPMLSGKRVAIVANQTSVIGKTHLVDSLLRLGVHVTKIFAPEHGFRGDVQAGGKIDSEKDKSTGLPIISLYGKKKKPSREDFNEIDVLIYDIQDIGCRFFTYISTLHYIMEAAAENKKSVMILDRPNPNGFYVAGCVLKDPSLVSFVGMHPVPIVYGMTVGEYAAMINGEQWLGTSEKRVSSEKSNLQCELTVVPLLNYGHDSRYELPIPPSPNLRTMNAIYLYPNLCLLEGTPVSVGRGTDFPFEVIGYPDCECLSCISPIEFTPRSIKGVADNPPYKDTLCKGVYVGEVTLFDYREPFLMFLSDIEYIYRCFPRKEAFFTPFFDKLAGTKELKQVIKGKIHYKEVEDKWWKDLDDFHQIRKKYLLYDDYTIVIENFPDREGKLLPEIIEP